MLCSLVLWRAQSIFLSLSLLFYLQRAVIYSHFQSKHYIVLVIFPMFDFRVASFGHCARHVRCTELPITLNGIMCVFVSMYSKPTGLTATNVNCLNWRNYLHKHKHTHTTFACISATNAHFYFRHNCTSDYNYFKINYNNSLFNCLFYDNVIVSCCVRAEGKPVTSNECWCLSHTHSFHMCDDFSVKHFWILWQSVLLKFDKRTQSLQWNKRSADDLCII